MSIKASKLVKKKGKFELRKDTYLSGDYYIVSTERGLKSIEAAGNKKYIYSKWKKLKDVS